MNLATAPGVSRYSLIMIAIVLIVSGRRAGLRMWQAAGHGHAAGAAVGQRLCGGTRDMDAIEVVTRLGAPKGRANPYPLYATLHEIGEVVVGYDAINSVLRDPGFRVSDESSFDEDFPGWRANPVFVQGADWILNLNAPRHPRIRSLIARAFTPRRIAGLEPAITTMADELLDGMADRGA